MPTDAEPFLQRIRAFPDDDVPRLIYADWLEETGGPAEAARAEFIRVQVALAQLPEDHPRRPTLLAAERELLDVYRSEWEAPFRRFASGPVFRRGFVDEVNIDARDYLGHAHELFAAAPIRHVHLLNVGGSLAAVMQSPYLGRLRELTVFASHLGEPLARAVARCPHLTGLRSLHLRRNRFEDDAAEQLAGSPVFAALEELDLSENDLGETAARVIAASPNLGKLRRLELRNNRLGPAGAEALAGSERLGSLERLGLSVNEVGLPRLHSLAGLAGLLRVPALDLAGNGLTADAVRAILAKPPGPDGAGLRELDLGHNDLGDAGAAVLANSPALANLQVLRLAACGIGDEGVRTLAASPHLGRLVALEVPNNPITDHGLRAFLDGSPLKHLRRLLPPAIGVSLYMQQTLAARFARAGK